MSISKGSARRTKKELVEALHRYEDRAITCLFYLTIFQFLKQQYPASPLLDKDGQPQHDFLTSASSYMGMNIQQAEQRKAAVIKQLEEVG